MKSIFLAAVVICALAIAGVGGTFATWSDSESSNDNYINTGSVDLKVNGEDDAPWGDGVPSKVAITCMIPCKIYGPYEVELWNAGQCQFPSHAYIHFKDVCCGNIPPKINTYPDGGSAYWPAGETTGYPDPNTGELKPEPELVAEYGGKVDCQTVPGVGVQGDNCTMKHHTYIWIMLDETQPVMGETYGEEVCAYQGKIIGIPPCEEIYLFDLMPCEPRTIYLWFHLQQDSEEMYDLDFIPDPGDVGYDELYWKKFNDWPSWALMKDTVNFSMEFDLWLEDTPGGYVYPEGYGY
jgi:predicted ribosomally synthesized peptide with SipW-like signal peptide